jgi:hypothetical protein
MTGCLYFMLFTTFIQPPFNSPQGGKNMWYFNVIQINTKIFSPPLGEMSRFGGTEGSWAVYLCLTGTSKYIYNFMFI